MSVLHADELAAALDSPMLTELEQDATDAKELGELLTDFLGYNCKKLAGSGWIKVNEKMQEFNEALEARAKLADSFGEKIKSALSKCLEFLGDDPAVESLNTEELDDITLARDSALNDYNYIYAHMRDTKLNSETGKEEPIWNIAECEAKLAVLDSNITLANKLIDKIGRMETVYSEALSELQGAYGEVETYGKAINDIVPSGMWKFDPKAPYKAGDYSFDFGEETNERPIVSKEENGIVIREGDEVTRREDGTVESITSPDGTVTYYYPEGNEMGKQYENGDYVAYNRDGSINKQSINGIVTENTYYEDGSIQSQTINGTEKTYEPGELYIAEDGTKTKTDMTTGSKTVTHPDGAYEVYRSDDTKEVTRDSNGITTFYDENENKTSVQNSNGDYVSFYDDGSIKEEYIEGPNPSSKTYEKGEKTDMPEWFTNPQSNIDGQDENTIAGETQPVETPTPEEGTVGETQPAETPTPEEGTVGETQPVETPTPEEGTVGETQPVETPTPEENTERVQTDVRDSIPDEYKTPTEYLRDKYVFEDSVVESKPVEGGKKTTYESGAMLYEFGDHSVAVVPFDKESSKYNTEVRYSDGRTQTREYNEDGTTYTVTDYDKNHQVIDTYTENVSDW